MDRAALPHLDALEVKSIHILRETAAQFRAPVMLYSIGKDSSVLQHLERVEVAPPSGVPAFRIPVQRVVRPHQDFRGYAGTIAAGEVSVGQSVSVEPGGRRSTVVAIVTYDGELASAVTLVRADEVDVCSAHDPKGLYRRAFAGTLPNFTGTGSPYEAPEHPELRLDGAALSAENAAQEVVDLLVRREEV